MKKTKLTALLLTTAMIFTGCGEQPGDKEGTGSDGEKDPPVVVNDGSLANPFTVTEAVALMDKAGDGVVVDSKEYYVTGELDAGTTYNAQYSEWSGTLGGKISIQAYLTEGMNVTPEDGALDGKSIVIKGFMELYQGAYKVSYLPASASPTKEKYTPTIVSIEGKSDYDDGYVPPVVKNPADELAALLLEGTGLELPELGAIGDVSATINSSDNVNGYYPGITTMYAYVEDNGTPGKNAIEDAYAPKFAGTKWVSINDDVFTVEDYGYMFADSADAELATVEICFYSYDGYFQIWVFDLDGNYSGHYIDYDGSEIPFWYEMLVEEGFDYTTAFPAEEIQDFLGVEKDAVIDLSNPDGVCYTFTEEVSGVDEETGEPYWYPAAATVVLDAAYEESILEYVNSLMGLYYDYFSDYYYAYSPNHEYEIDIYEMYASEEDYYPFAVCIDFIRMSDMFSTELSTADDWSTEDAQAMIDFMGITVPYMAFGVEGYWEFSEEYSCGYFCDYYIQDLTAAYGEILVADGYVYTPYDEEEEEGDYYTKEVDGALVYISLGWDYDGNSIYLEYYPAPTEIIIDQDDFSLAPGGSKQLSVSFGPDGCNVPGTAVEWSCVGENIEVSNDGLVTVGEEAKVGDVYSVTATCGDLTTSIDVTIVDVVPGFYKVTDLSQLSAGSKIVFACETKGTINGGLDGKFLSSVTATFANGMITSEVPEASVITLGGSEDAWTFSMGDSILGATANKNLSLTGGTTTWTIAVADGKATIASTDTAFGRILYNAQSPRYLNYSSSTSVNNNMLLPQIYVYVG